MYFVGVTTGSSSIMKIFPEWSSILGLNAELRGYDAPLHASAQDYQRIVDHIKADPLAMGALVTSHKIDLLAATRDRFEYLDPYALLCDEISSISKRDGRLEGHAKDPISSGLAWQSFVTTGYFARTGGQVLCFGAGGAATALTVYLVGLPNDADRPRKLIVVDVLASRLDSLHAIVAKTNADLNIEYVVNESSQRNDQLMVGLPPGSVVINATGMGKDRPGSPITDGAVFPKNGLVWEMNYRGELNFLKQAQHQQTDRHLHIEDGWVYFLHGWSQVVVQVFHRALTPALFNALDNAAEPFRI
jgi:shikimate 5-dehydrogenase